MSRRLELDILYWCTRAAIILLLPLFISDVYLYEEYANKLLREGLIPYKQWDLEYPPLAYPFMLVPGLLHKWLGLHGTESFRVLFGLLLLPFDFLLFRFYRSFPPFRGAAFAYILLTTAMGLLVFDSFDLVVGFLLAFPFLVRSGGEPRDWRFLWAWGLGGALKLVPLALAPFPPLFWKEFRFSRFLKYGLLISLPFAIACGSAALLAGGKISFLSHHSERGVQIESLVGSVLMGAQSYFKLVNTAVDTNFGAQHIGDVKGAVTSSRVLFYGTLALAYFFLWWGRRSRDSLISSWILISGFVTFGYVLSPQFLLWLIPLALIAACRVPAGGKRAIWLLTFCSAVLLTGVHFRFYWDYVNLYRLSVSAVIVRNLLLILLWGLSWRWMRAPVIAQPAEITDQKNPAVIYIGPPLL